ncbi:hypothetical protein ACS0TY_012115 [Phlomoides rotata]
MDDDVEVYVAILTAFGVLATMFAEMNSFIFIMSNGFFYLRIRSMYGSSIGGNYSIKSKLTRQLDNMHFLVNDNDLTCKYHIRMNSDCFNHLCYLLKNLGGLRLTRNVTISEQGYLGALDGTYIPVKVPHPDIPRYRNRKGNIYVNVLVVCDRNMNYIYVLSGWEGSAAYSRNLRDAVTRTNGLKVPTGSYYLCDGGYTNGNGFLAPYTGVRYHLKEWDESRQPQTYQEYFNLKHAKALKNTMETKQQDKTNKNKISN